MHRVCYNVNSADVQATVVNSAPRMSLNCILHVLSFDKPAQVVFFFHVRQQPYTLQQSVQSSEMIKMLK